MDAPNQSCRPNGWLARWPWLTGAPSCPAAAPGRAGTRRLFWLLVGVWIINLFDLGMTIMASRQRFMVELNPLAAQVLPHGTAAVVVYKLSLLVLGTALLWYCRQHWATEPAVWGYAVLCIALSFWWHHVYRDLNHSWVEFTSPQPARASPLVPRPRPPEPIGCLEPTGKPPVPLAPLPAGWNPEGAPS